MLRLSPAFDLCAVAADWTHAFYQGPFSLSDYRAGEAIVQAAGGEVSTAFDGQHNVIIAGPEGIVSRFHRQIAV